MERKLDEIEKKKNEELRKIPIGSDAEDVAVKLFLGLFFAIAFPLSIIGIVVNHLFLLLAFPGFIIACILADYSIKHHERKYVKVRDYYNRLYESVKKDYERRIGGKLDKLKNANFYRCKARLTEVCLLGVIDFADDLVAALRGFVEEGRVLGVREFMGRLGSDVRKCPWGCWYSVDKPEGGYVKVFEWVKGVWDAIYYDDIDKLKKLADEMRPKVRDESFRRKLVKYFDFPIETDFYLRLLEFHYFLAESVIREHEVRTMIARPAATAEADSLPVEMSWDNVLFEGSCSFKFGGVSQWRDGIIRVTGAGVELEGKLKVRSMNLTALAIKAAARAAGVGEVSERIPYSDISSYDYDSKKVVINAYGKKYVIKTPAASRIGSLLDRLVKG